MANNCGLTSVEIDAVHTINPEIAAHNIASAYVNSVTNNEKLFHGEDVILSDVLSLSNQYIEAYNYAYNFVIHENDILNHAE